MAIKLKSAAAFAALCAAMLVTFNAVAEEHLKKKIHGTLKNDVYTSDHGGFRVHVPVHEGTGGAVRDESGKMGDTEISQVIFTDDFGAYFRIVSLKTSGSMDNIMNVFHDVRDKKEIQTARGRELRVINVEKEGAEISVTTIVKGSPPQTTKPDLVTVNAVFTANGRIYHLCAGFPVLGNRTVDEIAESVRGDLESLLQGFEPFDTRASK